eukprot:gene5633-6502_t
MGGHNPPFHVPKHHKMISVALGTTMWFWVFYRAKKDWKTTLGLEYPWGVAHSPVADNHGRSPPQLPVIPKTTNERYLQSYQNYQKHANNIDFEKQFRIQNHEAIKTAPSYRLKEEQEQSRPISMEGLMYYNVVVMGAQKGEMNDRRWFILRDHLLYNHISKDVKATDVIDVRRLMINIDIRSLDDSDELRFGFRLRSQNNSIAHFMWADESKNAIMWLVALGHHTLNFSQDSEMEMINHLLEISQPESKPSLIMFNENQEDSVENIEKQFQQLQMDELKKQELHEQQQQDMHQQQYSSMRRNSSNSSFIDDIFDPQRKTFKIINKNADNKDILFKHIPVILNQREYEIGMMFETQVHNILNLIAKDADVEKLKQLIGDVIYEFTEIFLHKLQALTKTEERMYLTKLSVEKALFEHINSSIFSQYQRKYTAEDEEHNQKAMQFLTLTPVHLSIPQKFWLIDDELEGLQVVPYQTAIDVLKKLPSIKSPSEKIQCLVNTSDAICEAINSFWIDRKDKPESLVLGADDLLPLFTFVIIKSKLPFMYSESIFLQDYLDDALSTKMQGYFLVTYQTCLSLLCAWEIDDLLLNASKMFEKPQHQWDFEKKPHTRLAKSFA